MKITILKKFLFLIFAGLLIEACSDKTDSVPVETDPVIKQVRVAANWNLAETSANFIEAEIYDPQGTEDVQAVTVTIKNSDGIVLLNDSLFDDGAYFHPEDGDVIAGDGFFRNEFDAATDVSTSAGDYFVEINVSDRSGNLAAEPGEATVVFGYSYPTEFMKIEIPDTLKSGTDDKFFYITLFHQKGIDAIEQVKFKLFDVAQAVLLQETNMLNDGDFVNSGDVTAGDSVFSYRVKNSFAAGRQGSYKLIFETKDDFGKVDQSDPLDIYLENEGGTILQTDVPDEMQRPATSGSYTIELVTAAVQDPQGLVDVDSVYFLSKRPDGQMANNGIPLNMVDNGKPFNINNVFEETGDAIANDGTYSLSILLDSNAQTGVYVFRFYMRDKVGHLTTVSIDSVEVF